MSSLTLLLKVGAIVHGNTKAEEGLDPDALPTGIPIYSGHYHKPHIVEGTKIEYVGSPYQGKYM